MNKLIYGLLGLSLAGNAYFLFKSKDIVTQEPEQITITEKETVTVEVEDQELKAQYQQALADIGKLNKQLATFQELEKEHEQLKSQVGSEEIAFETTKNPDNDEFAKKHMEQSKRIKNAFKTETIDTEWAYQTQDLITNTLIQEGDTSLYSIEETSCKTSVCKVTIKPFSEAKGSGVMAMINASGSFQTSKQLRELETSMHIDTRNGKGSQAVDIYLWKEPKI